MASSSISSTKSPSISSTTSPSSTKSVSLSITRSPSISSSRSPSSTPSPSPPVAPYGIGYMLRGLYTIVANDSLGVNETWPLAGYDEDSGEDTVYTITATGAQWNVIVDADWPVISEEEPYHHTIIATASQGAMSRNLQVPSRTMECHGGGISESERAVPTLVATGTVHCIGTVDVDRPSYEIEINVGTRAVMTAPARTIVGSSTSGYVGWIDESVPSRTLVSNAQGVVVGTVDVNVPARTISAYDLLRFTGILDSEMPRRTVTGSGLVGELGTLDLNRFPYTIESGGLIVLTGTVNVTREFYTINSGTLTFMTLGTERLTSLALQFNVKQGANSEYTNYAFESLVMFNGKPFGSNSSGLFELTGEDDAGTDISAEIETGKTDFEVGNVKKPWSVHLGMAGEGSVRAKLKGARDIEITGKDAVIQEGGLKIKHSRDTRSSYWGLNLKNVDGSDFQLNYIDFVIETLGRREDY
jgi:hypothetical protein